MKIEQILHTKGHDVVTVSEGETVLAAAQALVERNIGSLVVMEGGRSTGIITERDVLRQTALRVGELGSLRVGDVMTRDVITAAPDDDLMLVMNVMTESKIRHLPVMEGDRLVGIISIGDLVNACRLSAEEENTQLRQYIQGGA